MIVGKFGHSWKHLLTLLPTSSQIGQVLAYMDENGHTEMEPKKEAMEHWCKLLNDVFEATVLPAAAKKAGSWYVGANIPGKPVRPLFWFGGVLSYFEITRGEASKNFPSLKMS